MANSLYQNLPELPLVVAAMLPVHYLRDLHVLLQAARPDAGVALVTTEKVVCES